MKKFIIMLLAIGAIALIIMRLNIRERVNVVHYTADRPEKSTRICVVHGSMPSDNPCYFDVDELTMLNAGLPAAIASVGNLRKFGSDYFLQSVNGDSKIRLIVDGASGLRYLSLANSSNSHVLIFGYKEGKLGDAVVRVKAIRRIDNSINGAQSLRMPGL